jgi:hypothetical protein
LKPPARLALLSLALLVGLTVAPATASAFEPTFELTGLAPESDVDPEAAALVRRLMRRTEMVRAHRALASISLLSLFTAQGFGIFNHAALNGGELTREQLAPTLMTHRLFAATAVSTWFAAGMVAWTMPGPDGSPARRKLFPPLGSGRRVHVALSIAHGLAMAATVALGAVSSFATRDTPAWNATVTAHHVAAATTSVLIVVAIGARSGSGS